MTVALAGEALAGVRPGHHVCCSFGSDDQHRAVVGRFGSEAIARGDRLIYLADRSDEASIRCYLDEAGVDSAAGLASGQIDLRAFGNTNMVDGSFDPERQIAELGVERARAKADGFAGLALVGEMSWVVGRPREADRIATYEREVGRIFSAADVTAVCQYDTRLFPGELFARLTGAHQFRIAIGPGWTRVEKGAVTMVEHDGGHLVLSGEADVANGDYVRCRLDEHRSDQGDTEVDVDGLSFIDVGGCRALIRAARGLPEGRRLVLSNPSPRLVRTLALCGWRDEPRLVVSGTGDGSKSCA